MASQLVWVGVAVQTATTGFALHTRVHELCACACVRNSKVDSIVGICFSMFYISVHNPKSCASRLKRHAHKNLNSITKNPNILFNCNEIVLLWINNTLLLLFLETIKHVICFADFGS